MDVFIDLDIFIAMRLRLTRKQMLMLLNKGVLPKGKSLKMSGATFNFIHDYSPAGVEEALNQTK